MKDDIDTPIDCHEKREVTRRNLMSSVALAVTATAVLDTDAQGQETAPAPSVRPRTIPPGGNGPIKVLFVTKFHPFDRENLFLALDSMGEQITWTHVEHPAAEAFYEPKLASSFDVVLFYDAFAGREQKPNSREFVDSVPSRDMQANLKKLLQNGDKGFVFLHHSIASWAHTWPAGVNGSNAYAEMIGAVADWGVPLKNIRGRDYPVSGYRQGTSQHITIVDKAHPIVEGLGDGFDIVDEAYLCPMFDDSVHCLARTDFHPTEQAFAKAPGINVGAGHPDGSNMTVWVKTAERSPIAYIQHGHDNLVWSNPAWRRLTLNAIKWAASQEAKNWAHANQKRIFV